MFFDSHVESDHAPQLTEAQLHAIYRKFHVLVHMTPRLRDFASPLANTLYNVSGADGVLVGITHGYGLQIVTALGILSHMTGSLIDILPETARTLMTSDDAFTYTHDELSSKYPIDDITLGVRFDTVVLTPMSLDGRPYGFIAFVSQKPNYFSQESVYTYRQISRFITMMLANIHKHANNTEMRHYERMTNVLNAPVSTLQSATVDMLQTLAHLRECYMTGHYQMMVDPLTQAFARIESIAKTTRDLRAISDLGKTPENMLAASVDVRQLLESVSEYNSTRLDEKDIHVMIDIDPEMPHIEGDFSILWQAIHEFVLNAMDALETKPQDAARELILRAYAAPNLVQIEVIDNGPGIFAADFAHVFEPGFTTRKGHKGLGLSRARLNIQRSKGEVVIEPRENGGTVVMILFADEEHTPQIAVF